MEDFPANSSTQVGKMPIQICVVRDYAGPASSEAQPIVDSEEPKKGLQTEICNPLISPVRVSVKPT